MRLRSPLILIPLLAVLVACAAQSVPPPSQPVGEPAPAHIDHFVPVRSTAPGYLGYISNLYVREIPAATPATGDVVLFVHGAGTPAEVAFDVPVPGYSWMRYLADRGLHVFAMDLTGYGRSTRPPQMAMPCNLSAQQHEEVFGEPCPPVHNSALTTMASDWDDIDGVVNYLLRRTEAARVHLVGWSQGGPRTGGYAARFPAKVASLVQLAPAYFRESPAELSAALLAGPVMTKQSRVDFMNGWNRQVGCENQYDPAVAEVIFDEMLASDPLGASWGAGVRRAPRVPTFGWTPDIVGAMQTPLLMVAGLQDAQITPDRVAGLYTDYGGRKMLLEMPCASHNAMWERDAAVLFEATFQWLTSGSYQGRRAGRLTQAR